MEAYQAISEIVKNTVCCLQCSKDEPQVCFSRFS